MEFNDVFNITYHRKQVCEEKPKNSSSLNVLIDQYVQKCASTNSYVDFVLHPKDHKASNKPATMAVVVAPACIVEEVLVEQYGSLIKKEEAQD